MRARAGSGIARDGHHNPDEIRGIPCAELFHDVGAMILNRTRADSELAPGFLVGGAGGELLQHFAFAPRQWFPPRKMKRCDIRRGVFCLSTCIRADRLIQPRDDFAAQNGFSMKSSAPLLIAL